MYSPTDGIISKIHKIKDNTMSIEISVLEIYTCLDRITDSDVWLLGFNPLNIHPRNYILFYLLMLPSCDRPFVIADGVICDDDLTVQYIEIIKANNNLLNPERTDIQHQKDIQTVKFRIETMYNNSKGLAKHTVNARPIKGIKGRISGKGGQIRNNHMGKRVNFSARTVIGADPSLRTDEIGMPDAIAENLTFPEHVNSTNIHALQKCVNDMKANFVDRFKSDGTKIHTDLKYAQLQGGTPLMYGDVIIRSTMNSSSITGSYLSVDYHHPGTWKGNRYMVGNVTSLKLINNDIIERDGFQMIPPRVGDVVTRKKTERFTIEDLDKFYIHRDDLVERDGKPITCVRYPRVQVFTLKIKDVVHRHLQDGDYVVFNRQPTLHKGSMLTKIVKRHEGKTFRMQMSSTSTFNADFDGDEMNVHAPQSVEAVAECIYLCSTQANMISAQAGKPNITLVQDNLVGAYQMTYGIVPIEKYRFNDITMYIKMGNKMLPFDYMKSRFEDIRRVLTAHGKKPNVYTGKGLLSLILPTDFNYTSNNMLHPKEPVLKIVEGVFVEGTLGKINLGSSHTSIVKILSKEYNSYLSCEFVDNVQYITNNWLPGQGFSVGLDDCLISKDKELEINESIEKCFIEAKGAESTTYNPIFKEVRINGALAKARDVGLRIAKNAMITREAVRPGEKSNGFLDTVNSGSKGAVFNLTQMTGLLGPQNLKGGRVPLMLNHGRRTLVHYPLGPLDPTREFESRGFIRHGFIHGLNPQEFYFHCMAGREGIGDTAVGTAKSGYIQRRIVKLCEDLTAQYDGTVRDDQNRIYQTVYGDLGLEASNSVKIGGVSEVCDVSRMIDRLNLQHEQGMRKVSLDKKRYGSAAANAAAAMFAL
jgi:DNA-directed RNA polymerase beta' subunit